MSYEPSQARPETIEELWRVVEEELKRISNAFIEEQAAPAVFRTDSLGDRKKTMYLIELLALMDLDSVEKWVATSGNAAEVAALKMKYWGP